MRTNPLVEPDLQRSRPQINEQSANCIPQLTDSTDYESMHCSISEFTDKMCCQFKLFWLLRDKPYISSIDSSLNRSPTALFGMPLFTCGTNFLLLFMFLISSILHHHPALLHHHILMVEHLLTFFWHFPLILNVSFSRSLSVHSCLSLPQADLLEL